MSKVSVGVLRGGPSPEYYISLQTGQSVLENLHDKYKINDVFIDKEGKWFLSGIETSPSTLANQIDVYVNALHGIYGEDGNVVRDIELFGTPHTGSLPYSAALSMNKFLSKDIFGQHEIVTPKGAIVSDTDDISQKAFDVFNASSPPWVVKPVRSGSSIGTQVAHTYDELKQAIHETFFHGHQVLVEEYINGIEVSCSVTESSDGTLAALPPVEIWKSNDSLIVGPGLKYNHSTLKVCPAKLDSVTTHTIGNAAIKAHKALGLSHHSQSDFIISPEGEAYLLEINSLPKLTIGSPFRESLKAVNVSLREYLDHIIDLAIKRK